MKSLLSQSIIRIVFSEEKFNYLNKLKDEKKSKKTSLDDLDSFYEEKSTSKKLSLNSKNSNQSDKTAQFEISFVNGIVHNCVKFYYDNFGDTTQVLFRREEAYDDLIKTIFLIYGHRIYHQLTLPLKKYIEIYSKQSINEKVISVEDFSEFYMQLLKILSQQMPYILRLVLYYVNKSVSEIYKCKTYEPVLTVLFFNFVFSPRIEDINGMSPVKYHIMKDINRIVKNICFNETFSPSDDLGKFNSKILNMHKLTNRVIDSLLKSIEEDEIAERLNEEMYSSVLIPGWLFYYDADFLLRFIEETNYFKERKKGKWLLS